VCHLTVCRQYVCAINVCAVKAVCRQSHVPSTPCAINMCTVKVGVTLEVAARSGGSGKVWRRRKGLHVATAAVVSKVWRWRDTSGAPSTSCPPSIHLLLAVYPAHCAVCPSVCWRSWRVGFCLLHVLQIDQVWVWLCGLQVGRVAGCGRRLEALGEVVNKV
jgi:hypothetical protein